MLIKKDIARFSSDAQLLSELGERLIAKPDVALAELIKNAYDADATKVHVWVAGKGSRSTLSVWDNGVGMTETEFLRYWMTIAATGKLGREASRKFHRPLTGSKGVGRFAARLLGRLLQLQSTAYDKSANEYRQLSADFDWGEFSAGKEVEKVEVPYRLERAQRKEEQGTLLRIAELQTEWADDALRTVTNQVFDLVTPAFGLAPPSSSGDRQDPGFAVFFSEPGVEESHAVAGSELLERALSRVTLTVRDGKVQLEYAYEGAKPRRFESRLSENLIGNVWGEIRYFPKRPGMFRGIRTIDGRKVPRWLREKGGVRVIDRGFRLLPYGEPDDDWLELSAAKAVNAREWGSYITKALFPEGKRNTTEKEDPLLKVPANHQVLGAVFVESYRPRPRDAEGMRRRLEPAMDRQGFVENEGFEQLQQVVRAAVELFAVVDVDETLRRRKREARERAAVVQRQIQSAIGEVRANEEIAEPEKRAIITSYRKIAAQVSRMDEANTEARRAIETMSLLGVLAGFMTHEVTLMLRAVEKMLSRWQRVPAAQRDTDYDELVGATREALNQIKHHIDYAEAFISDVREGQQRTYPVRAQVERVIRQLRTFTRDRHVDAENKVPGDYTLTDVPVSVCSGILLNLYTNAIKAVLAVKAARAGRIVFDVVETPKGRAVRVADNGIGIPEEMAHRVFEPLFSTTAPAGPLGTSMGLGLYIVRRLLEETGGRISIVEAPTGFTTAFAVRFGK